MTTKHILQIEHWQFLMRFLTRSMQRHHALFRTAHKMTSYGAGWSLLRDVRVRVTMWKRGLLEGARAHPHVNIRKPCVATPRAWQYLARHTSVRTYRLGGARSRSSSSSMPSYGHAIRGSFQSLDLSENIHKCTGIPFNVADMSKMTPGLPSLH